MNRLGRVSAAARLSPMMDGKKGRAMVSPPAACRNLRRAMRLTIDMLFPSFPIHPAQSKLRRQRDAFECVFDRCSLFDRIDDVAHDATVVSALLAPAHEPKP